MRNLKKLLAVILSVVMIASMMVPALAANTYEAEALKLQAINVFAGGPEDLKLDEGVTRIQGLTFAIRAAGKDDDALAMEDEEVDTILADWTDADSIPQWGRKYAAYAIKNSITVGLSATEKIFGALNPISGTSFLVFVMKSGMGYADVTTADVIDAAVEAGILSAGQAIEFGQKEALIRDDAAGILYGAFTTGVNADGTKLIDAYIASGATTLEDAIEAGFVEEEVPEELEVVDVSATTLVQAVVSFNQPVDKDTATDKDNYAFAAGDKITISKAELAEDGSTVILTFPKVDQQKTATLTISGVKSVDGETIKKVSKEVYFLDNSIPEIIDAEVVGISTIKVTFSEPMDPTTVKATSFKVNDGKFYVKGVSPQKNNTEFLVELYTSLKTGDLPFEVKVGPADYAGFTAMGLITTLSVVEDKDAPVVIGYKDAKPHSIVLIWSEDIKLDKGDADNYYHTNSSNKIKSALTDSKIDGNEMTLEFKELNKLPNGTAYVYVLKESVKDYWNNKNAQQMVKVEVTVDEEAPVLEKIEVKAENKIVLTFDEDVKAATANKKSNYTLLDKDGKEVKNIFGSFEIDEKKVTINFTKKLAGGEYTLVLEDIEDLVGNAMNKTSESFTVTDKTAPLAKDFSAKLYVIGDGANADQIIKISFGEEMSIDGAYGINDLSKYVLNETPSSVALEDIDDVTIEVVDGGKGVEITVPKGEHEIPASIIGENKNGLKIGRVADAAGNYTAAFENVIDILPSGTVKIEKAELTGAKEIKVYFSDELAKFEAKEVKFDGAFANAVAINNDEDISTVSTELKDGKTVAVYTFTEEFPYTADGLSVKTKAAPTGDEAEHETANSYGELLEYGANVPVKDKLAPALATIEVDDEDKDDVVVFERTSANVGTDNELHTSKIRLTFKENLDPRYISFGSFVVSGFNVLKVDISENEVTITVTNDSVHVDVNTSISLRSPIRDTKGNELVELETTVSKVEGTVTVTGE